MNKYVELISSEFRKNKLYFIIALGSLIMVYILDIVLDKDVVVGINWEDGFFENLTAIALFLSAMAFLVLFFRTRKVIHLLFVVVFIFGAGEEISWGERILDFEVPQSIADNNTQHEFNVHNLKVFSSFDSNGIKPGLSRYITVSALYLLFCFFYGIVLPALQMRIGFIRKIVERIHLPVPPLILGILFLVNYIVYRSISHLDVMGDPSIHFHSIIDESFEFCSVLIFLLISLSFLQHIKKPKGEISSEDQIIQT